MVFTDLFTARKRSLGQGIVLTRVCDLLCSQWGRGSAYRGGLPTEWRGLPTGEGVHLQRGLPREGGGWAETPPSEPEKWAVRILLECLLVLVISWLRTIDFDMSAVFNCIYIPYKMQRYLQKFWRPLENVSAGVGDGGRCSD